MQVHAKGLDAEMGFLVETNPTLQQSCSKQSWSSCTPPSPLDAAGKELGTCDKITQVRHCTSSLDLSHHVCQPSHLIFPPLWSFLCAQPPHLWCRKSLKTSLHFTTHPSPYTAPISCSLNTRIFLLFAQSSIPATISPTLPSLFPLICCSSQRRSLILSTHFLQDK